MSELQLSGALIESVHNALAEYDETASDPVVAMQYLAATMSFILSHQPIPTDEKKDMLEQLCAFAHHVFENVNSQQPAAPPPRAANSGDAFGIWKPPVKNG